MAGLQGALGVAGVVNQNRRPCATIGSQVKRSYPRTRPLFSCRHTTVLAAITLMLGCGGDSGTNPPPPPKAKAIVLVVTSPGVIGVSPVGDSLVTDSGTSISYSFELSSGYTNLYVTLDSQPVGAKGALVAVGRKTLRASADTVLFLSSGDSSIIRASRSILSSSNPYAAYLGYQRLADSLRAVVGITAADERLRLLETQTFDPVQDAYPLATALRAVVESLSVSGASLQPTAPKSEAVSAYSTVFIYVNGIWTFRDGFNSTVENVVKPLVATAGFSDPSKYLTTGFYNPTEAQVVIDDAAAWICYNNKFNLLLTFQFGSLAKSQPCPGPEATLGDIPEAAIQVGKAVFGLTPGLEQPDVIRFADTISTFLSQGSRVVIIAHSQGNLYAQQALALLQEGPLSGRLGCVGVVGLAPPTSFGWPVGASSVQQEIAQGTYSEDLMLQLFQPLLVNTQDRPNTIVTDRWDRDLGFLLKIEPLAAIATGVDIHSLESDYANPLDRTTYSGVVSNIVLEEGRARLGCTNADALSFDIQPYTNTAGLVFYPPLEVTARDVSGQVDGGFNGTVTLTITPGTGASGAVLSGTTSVRAVAGVAQFQDLHIDRAGAGYTLTATATGPSAATSVPFNIVAGPPSAVAFTIQPSNAGAGTRIAPPLQVTAQDAFSNVATVFSGAVTVAIGNNPSGGTLSGTTTVAAVAGVATFNLSIDKAGTGYTLTASSGTLTGATSNPFNITPPPATQLAFTGQPSNTAAGATITPAVKVTARDANGNTATSFTGNVTVAIGTNPPGNGVLSGTTTVAAVAGVATFNNLSIDKAGNGYTLTATATGLTEATSATFNITPPPPQAQLAFTVQPSNTVAGETISPAVQVTAKDGNGNTVTSFTGNVTLTIGTNPSGGTLGGTLTKAAVAGTATFSNLSIDKAGNGYTLNAAAAGLAQKTSNLFSISFHLFTQLTAGESHTCGITPTRVAYCWGANGSGQLGDGGTNPRSYPLPVLTSLNFTQVAAGASHTCGLAGQAVYCWGENGAGQLGDGSGQNQSRPALVKTNVTFTQVFAGGSHTCGLTSSGVAYCWGLNNHGELGNGDATLSPQSTPAKVQTNLAFASLALGEDHSCGVALGGSAYCWGSNSDGQLGDSSGVDQVSPVAVRTGLAFNELAAGSIHTCGLEELTQNVYCWGNNFLRQVGDSTVGSSVWTPVAVDIDHPFFDFGAGWNHTCGFDGDGAGPAWCWGENSSGQLGDGTMTDQWPTQVQGTLLFTQLVGGEFHTCGLAVGGTAYCWGADEVGELGDGTTTASRGSPTPVH